MGYVEAFEKASSTFPNAIEIASPSQIKQNGLYLLFDGSKSFNTVKDELFFSLVIAANSYTKENGVMQKVDELRITSNEAFAEHEIRWLEIKAISFAGSELYFMECRFKMTISI